MADLFAITPEEAANPHAVAAALNRIHAFLLVSHSPDGMLRAETIPSGKATQGLPGEKGDRGERGEKGEPGAPGSEGLRGPKGEKGDRGERGEKGPKGDKGDPGEPSKERGPKGDRGEKGDTGPAGPRGPWGQLTAGSLPVEPNGSGTLWNDNGIVRVSE